MSRNPDFIVIGAMKSGTTALCSHLNLDERIFAPKWKEPGYFSREEIRARGSDWYRSLFKDPSFGQISGEGSTCYSRWPHFGDVAERMRAMLPDVKLIYLMRHPVERCYSHYKHLMEERFFGTEEPILTFDQALDEIPEIVDTSKYVMQIERFSRLYPRDRFLFLTTDDLRETRQALLSSVQCFLGLEERELPLDRPIKENRAGDTFQRRATRRHLQSIRRRSVMAALAKLVPARVRLTVKEHTAKLRGVEKAVAERREEFKSRLSPLEPETRRKLLEMFSEPTRELEKLLERPLATWFE